MWCNDACDAMMYVTYWFTWSNYFSIIYVIHRLYSKVKGKCVYVWSMFMHGFMWCNDWCDAMIDVMQWFMWCNNLCDAMIDVMECLWVWSMLIECIVDAMHFDVMQWFMWCNDSGDAMIDVMQWFMWSNFSSDVIMYVTLYVTMYA